LILYLNRVSPNVITEEERKEEFKKAFFEYAAYNTLSAFDIPAYFQDRFAFKKNKSKSFLESFLLYVF